MDKFIQVFSSKRASYLISFGCGWSFFAWANGVSLDAKNPMFIIWWVFCALFTVNFLCKRKRFGWSIKSNDVLNDAKSTPSYLWISEFIWFALLICLCFASKEFCMTVSEISLYVLILGLTLLGFIPVEKKIELA